MEDVEVTKLSASSDVQQKKQMQLLLQSQDSDDASRAKLDVP